jgi:putative phosphoribosyl transferase
MILPYRNTWQIPVGKVSLEGNLSLPPDPKGLVIFSHGSGSSRFSPRNNFVSEELFNNDIGTFLFDQLTREEGALYSRRFDVNLLAERLVFVTEWLSKISILGDLPFGYFGASTGAASAIIASVILKEKIKALVIRGGRPDLASAALTGLSTPVLFIVGELDVTVRRLNEDAYARVKSPRQLKIIPSATHLFEEPGALEEVSDLSVRWFSKYLTTTKKKGSFSMSV